MEKLNISVYTCSQMRTLLRRWLGILATDARVVQLQGEVDGFKQMASQVLEAQGKVNTALRQVNEAKEMLTDPKRTPIIAKTTRQFRQLMGDEG